VITLGLNSFFGDLCNDILCPGSFVSNNGYNQADVVAGVVFNIDEDEEDEDDEDEEEEEEESDKKDVNEAGCWCC
jgi:hypothetical protein